MAANICISLVLPTMQPLWKLAVVITDKLLIRVVTFVAFMFANSNLPSNQPSDSFVKSIRVENILNYTKVGIFSGFSANGV